MSMRDRGSTWAKINTPRNVSFTLINVLFPLSFFMGKCCNLHRNVVNRLPYRPFIKEKWNTTFSNYNANITTVVRNTRGSLFNLKHRLNNSHWTLGHNFSIYGKLKGWTSTEVVQLSANLLLTLSTNTNVNAICKSSASCAHATSRTTGARRGW